VRPLTVADLGRQLAERWPDRADRPGVRGAGAGTVVQVPPRGVWGPRRGGQGAPAAAPEQPDHVAVDEIEVHRLVVGPLKALHREVLAERTVASGDPVLVGKRRASQGAVAQKYQVAAGAQQPGRVRDPGEPRTLRAMRARAADGAGR